MKTLEILDKTEIAAIINACDCCIVSSTTTDGLPYALPMNFFYEAGELVLHSAPVGMQVSNIQANPHVCIVFLQSGALVYQHVDVACSYRMQGKSVICNGKVSFVDDIGHKMELLNKFMHKYTGRTDFKYSEPALKNVKVWLVDITQITARAFGVPVPKLKV